MKKTYAFLVVILFMSLGFVWAANDAKADVTFYCGHSYVQHWMYGGYGDLHRTTFRYSDNGISSYGRTHYHHMRYSVYSRYGNLKYRSYPVFNCGRPH